MAKFRVLAPIERADILYLPQGMTPPAHWSPVLDADGKQTGWTAPSASHGRPVPVDSSGAIELTALEAGPLRAAGAIGEESPGLPGEHQDTKAPRHQGK